ncbi:hypothetical protein XF_0642 [Xylella fastidiosa 9a5c]|uniref:Uncharacterized protein n=1 Tax=Xylella fastidiosa (strain 9a5c) TaxID=160492 RepID=Q9PFL5_XYLFA|nr:hypothetical protein XF_0642 [Xylella fastidiosa 9a5c]TNW22886.1 hypothetical protein EIP73_08330 [Xylella fastidiosa subsp. pauca]
MIQLPINSVASRRPLNADVAYMQLLLHWGIFCQEFRQAFEQCMLCESNWNCSVPSDYVVRC